MVAAASTQAGARTPNGGRSDARATTAAAGQEAQSVRAADKGTSLCQERPLLAQGTKPPPSSRAPDKPVTKRGTEIPHDNAPKENGAKSVE